MDDDDLTMDDGDYTIVPRDIVTVAMLRDVLSHLPDTAIVRVDFEGSRGTVTQALATPDYDCEIGVVCAELQLFAFTPANMSVVIDH